MPDAPMIEPTVDPATAPATETTDTPEIITRLSHALYLVQGSVERLRLAAAENTRLIPSAQRLDWRAKLRAEEAQMTYDADCLQLLLETVPVIMSRNAQLSHAALAQPSETPADAASDTGLDAGTAAAPD